MHSIPDSNTWYKSSIQVAIWAHSHFTCFSSKKTKLRPHNFLLKPHWYNISLLGCTKKSKKSGEIDHFAEAENSDGMQHIKQIIAPKSPHSAIRVEGTLQPFTWERRQHIGMKGTPSLEALASAKSKSRKRLSHLTIFRTPSRICPSSKLAPMNNRCCLIRTPA